MVPSALASGLSALSAARWQEAHDLLLQAVAESPTGIALEALGEACSWLDYVDTIEVRERTRSEPLPRIQPLPERTLPDFLGVTQRTSDAISADFSLRP